MDSEILLEDMDDDEQYAVMCLTQFASLDSATSRGIVSRGDYRYFDNPISLARFYTESILHSDFSLGPDWLVIDWWKSIERLASEVNSSDLYRITAVTRGDFFLAWLPQEEA